MPNVLGQFLGRYSSSPYGGYATPYNSLRFGPGGGNPLRSIASGEYFNQFERDGGSGDYSVTPDPYRNDTNPSDVPGAKAIDVGTLGIPEGYFQTTPSSQSDATWPDYKSNALTFLDRLHSSEKYGRPLTFKEELDNISMSLYGFGKIVADPAGAIRNELLNIGKEKVWPEIKDYFGGGDDYPEAEYMDDDFLYDIF